MTVRTITPREMLRLQACEQLLGCNQLTPELRYEQARIARQLRNFFFTATLQPRSGSFTVPVDAPLLARTPAFSENVVLTDLLSMVEYGQTISQSSLSLEVLEYGGEERSYGLNFFGLTGPVPQRYILKHEKNRSTAPVLDFDLQGRFVGYLPRLLVPYQQLEFRWTNLAVGGGGLDITDLFLQAGMRAVRAMGTDNPYSYFSTLADRRIKDYIAGSRPETFFLEVQLPLASFPAANVTVQIKTPQQERPLLILGATTNLEGAQAELTDESLYYTFTKADNPIARIPGIPMYKAPPLALWAANSDFRNMNMYNMWAVPHLLEGGAQLTIRLTNGIRPDAAGAFIETMLTRSEQPARIVFLCRTV